MLLMALLKQAPRSWPVWPGAAKHVNALLACAGSIRPSSIRPWPPSCMAAQHLYPWTAATGPAAALARPPRKARPPKVQGQVRDFQSTSNSYRRCGLQLLVTGMDRSMHTVCKDTIHINGAFCVPGLSVLLRNQLMHVPATGWCVWRSRPAAADCCFDRAGDAQHWPNDTGDTGEAAAAVQESPRLSTSRGAILAHAQTHKLVLHNLQ